MYAINDLHLELQRIDKNIEELQKGIDVEMVNKARIRRLIQEIEAGIKVNEAQGIRSSLGGNEN